MKIKIAVAGATGTVGKAVIAGIIGGQEFEIVSAVARKTAGQDLGQVLNLPIQNISICSTVAEALNARPQVLIDYTHASIAYENCLAAIQQKVAVVIGSSGLTREQLEELGRIALLNGVGVFSAGNFSVTAALLQHLSVIAANYLPSWEIIDFGKPKYTHAPSSTARELADMMANAQIPHPVVPPDKTLGMKEARGATIAGAQVHSVRSHGYGFSVETIFGLPNERLTLRHDASESPEPYVHGTLLAAKAVTTTKGLTRGIGSILFKGEDLRQVTKESTWDADTKT